jgi:hypothetical protein
MVDRRTVLAGILSLPIASALPNESHAVLPKINFPLTYEESSAFCQTQKLKFGEFFTQLLVTKNDDKNENSTFGMSMDRISSHDKLIENSYDTPYDIISQCPIREIKNTKEKLKFEINKLGAEIARKSRRGLGYVILCHPSKLEYVRSLNLTNKDIHSYSDLKEDEYVCLYNNMKLIPDKPMTDGAIYKVYLENHDPKYIPNRNFKDYIIRFKINEVTE